VYDSLITARDLYKNLKNPDWVVIDCHFVLSQPDAGRTAYDESHIPGAVYAHLERDLSGKVYPGKTGRHPLPEIVEFSETVSRWGIDKTVQVIAYDNAGGSMAARLWWLLKWLGHDKAAVLDGGLKAWKEAEYPLEKKSNENPRRNFTPAPRSEMILDLSISNNPLPEDLLIVDSRASERYKGQTEPIDPVAGRIPGAVNLFYQDNLDSREKFKSRRKLEDRFSKIIYLPPNKVVFYCGSGVTAVHNILAMYAAGMGVARLYPGSWSKWITDPERPVERD
jgi:thiosulfate/3-mercaptopyruvate sulfurtransferase